MAKRFTQADLDRIQRGERQRSPTVLSRDEGRALFGGGAQPTAPAGGSKLHNEATVFEGHRYDSKAEARHAARLALRLRAGELANVEPHVVYKLVVNDVEVGSYEVDFRLTYPDGRQEFHDVKGQRSGVPYRLFKLKQALMRACLGIEVLEISGK